MLRRKLVRDESGITLVELLVSSFISMIAGTVFVAALVGVQGMLNQQQVRTNSQADVRLASQRLDREVRSGSLLYNPADESPAYYSLRIFSPDASGNRCIQWRITDRQLIRRTWVASYGETPDPATVSEWLPVAGNLINVDLARPAFALSDSATGTVGRTLRVVFVTNTRPADHPDGTMVVEQSLTGRNTTTGSARIENACTPAPAG